MSWQSYVDDQLLATKVTIWEKVINSQFNFKNLCYPRWSLKQLSAGTTATSGQPAPGSQSPRPSWSTSPPTSATWTCCPCQDSISQEQSKICLFIIDLIFMPSPSGSCSCRPTTGWWGARRAPAGSTSWRLSRPSLSPSTLNPLFLNRFGSYEFLWF